MIGSNPDYADLTYCKPLTESFKSKTETFQYNSDFIITGTIKETSLDKIYQELGLESLVCGLERFFLSQNWKSITTGLLQKYVNSSDDGSIDSNRAVTRNRIKSFSAKTKLFDVFFSILFFTYFTSLLFSNWKHMICKLIQVNNSQFHHLTWD